MKKLITAIAFTFVIPAFATNNNHHSKDKEHHQHNQPSKPDVPSPRPPTASKRVPVEPSKRSNTEGDRDVCDNWFKPSYCFEKK